MKARWIDGRASIFLAAPVAAPGVDWLLALVAVAAGDGIHGLIVPRPIELHIVRVGGLGRGLELFWRGIRIVLWPRTAK